MAALVICSDFGAPQNKVCHCFHCFPISLPWLEVSSRKLDTKGTFHAKMGSINDRVSMDLAEKQKILRRGVKSTQNCTKNLHCPDNHDGVISHLEPDILECEVKWVLGSITTNKASGGDGIPVELFQILKVDSLKVLHSICQQIWKTHH